MKDLRTSLRADEPDDAPNKELVSGGSARESSRCHRSVMSVLQRRAAKQREDRERAGATWHESDPVLPTGLGTPIHPCNDYRSLQLAARVSLRRIRLQGLRHTTASLLLARESRRVAMEILGHSQISVTLNTYTHIDPELNRVATDRMEQALWPSE